MRPISKALYPKIEKYVGDENASRIGAFSAADSIRFKVSVPLKLGCSAPIFRIKSDGGNDIDTMMTFVSTDYLTDVYEVSFYPRVESGLFYYTFVFPNGNGAYFTEPYNNVDFELTDSDSCRFSMLIYEKDYITPSWLRKGVMYQIFTDRFYKGSGEVVYDDDAIINHDWDNGIPQYGERVGSYVKNNMFFGGNLWGVVEKLSYLKSLGVSVIYLNPIFSARSNHKYDTSDYMSVDKCFGGDAAFKKLTDAAKECGIRIILDGVFNHTGDDSVYFDRYGKYNGAYSNANSVYRDWYIKKQNSDEYECWWGIPILPKLDQRNENCRRYFTGENGVAEKYLSAGASGWRLDVADELCNEFLDELRVRVKSVDPSAAIIGEVWENAAEKLSYGERRRYLQGRQLDSVMNYPFRNAVISFVRDGDGEQLYNTLTSIYGSYPKQVCNCLMNIIGTHDTERILTALGGDPDIGYDNASLANKKMTLQQREKGKQLLRIAAVLQYTIYGIPSLYYGDEAGLEGYHDPFCRKPFPWGNEDTELLNHYRLLGELRNTHKAFDNGDFEIISHGTHHIAYKRSREGDEVIVAVNKGEDVVIDIQGKYTDILTGIEYKNNVNLKTDTVVILV